MNICFIGGGNMASALIGGLLKRGYSPAKINVVEINAETRTRLHQAFCVQTFHELEPALPASQVIILAVKPQQLQEVARRLEGRLDAQLLISIAAGVRAADIARWSGSRHIVRAMPNTPALIRLGVTGLYALPEVNAEQRQTAQSIMVSVGTTLWVEQESAMDAITAVSGSGPAYVFYFIEALQQAARELGLSESDSRELALETFRGAIKLALAAPEDVTTLRARVTSKNGTTERALHSMEAHGVKTHIMQAVHAAYQRSIELGDELGKAGQ